MIYVREDILSKELKNHQFTKNMETIFVEIYLRKNKLLLVGTTHHSIHHTYGTSNSGYFEQIGLALDVYSKYDEFLIAGDFNIQEDESSIQDVLDEFNGNNLVKENTCFKSLANPSSIDLFLKLPKTTTLCSGLSDLHKMIVTVLKTAFPKAKPKIMQYIDYSKRFERENEGKVYKRFPFI